MPPVNEERLRLIIEAEVAKALSNIQATEKALVHLAGGVDSVSAKGRDVDGLGQSFGKMGAGASGALGPLTLLKGAIPALGLASLATGVFKTAAAFESARSQFGVLLQDAEKGDKVFSDLLDFNAKTPFTQGTLNSVATQLLNARVSAEELIPTIGKLGDLSKGNEQKLSTLAEVYGRIGLKGKASMEELNRVIEAGVPITAALGQAMGVSEDKVFDMVTKGQVGAEAFRVAIDKLTGAGGQYNGMMDKMAQSTEGKFSTAVGNVEIITGTLGGKLEGVTKAGLDGFNGLSESAIKLLDAASPLIVPLANISGLFLGGGFAVATEIFNSIADGLYLITGNSAKTSASLKEVSDAVEKTNSAWSENLKVYQTLSGKQTKTKEETEAMRTAYVNLKTMLPGVTDETLKYALATGRVSEAMKLQDLAATLTKIGKESQALGAKATSATSSIINGFLDARENLKRAGAVPLPYSLDFEVSSEEIGKLDKSITARMRQVGGKSFISLGDLGYLDEATKKTIVLRKAEEVANIEAKTGDKAKAEMHRELAAAIVAEQKILAEKGAIEKRLAGDTKALYEGIKTPNGIVAPLQTPEPTDADKWTDALKAYRQAVDESSLANKRNLLSSDAMKASQDQAAKTFVQNVSGLRDLSREQVAVVTDVFGKIQSSTASFEGAWTKYIAGIQTAQLVQANLGSSTEEFSNQVNQVMDSFVKEAGGLKGLSEEQLQLLRTVEASIANIRGEAGRTTDETVDLVDKTKELWSSIDAGFGHFGQLGEIASKAFKALAPDEKTLEDLNSFMGQYAAGFGALFDSVVATASAAFAEMDAAQVRSLEAQVDALERQKESYKESSDNEIQILEQKGESSVDARIRQNNEEIRLQAEIDKKKKELAKRQFESEKQTKLAQIAMATALGVANTFSAGAWAIPLALGITALGGVQAAIVQGEQFPEAYNGAEILGSAAGTVIRAGERNKTEMVLPLREERLRELGIGGSGLSIGQFVVQSSASDPAEVARVVRRELEWLARTNR